MKNPADRPHKTNWTPKCWSLSSTVRSSLQSDWTVSSAFYNLSLARQTHRGLRSEMRLFFQHLNPFFSVVFPHRPCGGWLKPCPDFHQEGGGISSSLCGGGARPLLCPAEAPGRRGERPEEGAARLPSSDNKGRKREEPEIKKVGVCAAT